MNQKEIRDSFKNKGIVTLNSFLNEDEKQIIKEIIYSNFELDLELESLSHLDLESDIFHQKLIKLRKNNPKRFGEIYDNINLNARFRSLFMQNRFLRLFSSVLNIDINKVFINGFMLRFDAPMDERNSLGWHQDSPYYMMSSPKFNSGVCWMSVTKNSSENGTLVYVPNTHHEVLPSKSTKSDNFSSEQLRVDVSEAELKSAKNLDQVFGDLSILHMNIKHRSGVNSSSKVRITMGCRFHDMSESFNSGKEIYKFNDQEYNK